MFKKILCWLTLLQFFFLVHSFESGYQEQTFKPSTDGDYDEIEVEQIQMFFETFRQVLPVRS